MLKLNEDFIKNYDEGSDKGYILEVDIKYPKNLYDLHSGYYSYQKEWELITVISLYATCMVKKNSVVHITALKQELDRGLRTNIKEST